MKLPEAEKQKDKQARKVIVRSYTSQFLSGKSFMNTMEKKLNHKSIWVSKIFYRGEKLKGKNS